MRSIVSLIQSDAAVAPALWEHLTVFTIGYLIYLFSDRATLVSRLAGVISRDGTDEGRQEWVVYLQRLLGFLLLGVLPFILTLRRRSVVALGLSLPRGDNVILWSVIPVAIVVAVMVFRARKNIPLDFYPQVRQKEWNGRRILLNALFWLIYLIGYEFAFRGYIFFPLIEEVGLTAAVAINASVYALAHIYKGPGEAFGAFALGIAFCVIAFATGSFVIPTVVHVMLAIGNDMAAVAENPEMCFKIGKSG